MVIALFDTFFLSGTHLKNRVWESHKFWFLWSMMARKWWLPFIDNRFIWNHNYFFIMLWMQAGVLLCEKCRVFKSLSYADTIKEWMSWSLVENKDVHYRVQRHNCSLLRVNYWQKKTLNRFWMTKSDVTWNKTFIIWALARVTYTGHVIEIPSLATLIFS